MERQLSLQDRFLNSVRRSKSPATLFLMKGVRLQGLVSAFDAFSVLIRRDSTSQLIYKHAISTIVPGRAPDELDALVAELQAAAEHRRPALQDLFLATASREQEVMTLFLVNGVMLQGRVAAFDQFSLLLERESQVQLVYKHAISTLQPENPLPLAAPVPETAK